MVTWDNIMINRKIFCKSCPWLLLVSVVVNWWRINTTGSDICDMVIVDWISVMIVFFEQMENIPTQCMLHCSFCCVFKTVFIRLRCLWSATNSILLTRQMYVRHCHISYAYGTGQNAQNMCGDLGNWWVARGMDVLHVHPTSQERRS